MEVVDDGSDGFGSFRRGNCEKLVAETVSQKSSFGMALP